MHRPGGTFVRMLAMAAATAMLVSALSASTALAAKGEVACKVHNLGQVTDRASLQKAVRDAHPGDALLVQGMCTGTTFIDKDLDISYMGWAGAPMPLGDRYVIEPRGRIASEGSSPALVVDPSVRALTINPGLHVSGGIVISDVEAWLSDASATPTVWTEAAPSTLATIPSTSLSDCHVRNDATGAEFEQSQQALDATSVGEQLSLRGTCGGETVIEEAARVAGWRIAISSLTLGEEPGGADDSGPATLAQVSVDADVDSLVLKDVRVTQGFTIADLEQRP